MKEIKDDIFFCFIWHLHFIIKKYFYLSIDVTEIELRCNCSICKRKYVMWLAPIGSYYDA